MSASLVVENKRDDNVAALHGKDRVASERRFFALLFNDDAVKARAEETKKLVVVIITIVIFHSDFVLGGFVVVSKQGIVGVISTLASFVNSSTNVWLSMALAWISHEEIKLSVASNTRSSKRRFTEKT